jgi:hypothetical protein
MRNIMKEVEVIQKIKIEKKITITIEKKKEE